jgi:site-specific DNA-methyltransferase (adenine-specific)
MRYLVRLVTPPNGTVIDPFVGSGTTLIAASLEGFEVIGIEKSEEYCKIAKKRLKRYANRSNLKSPTLKHVNKLIKAGYKGLL